ncbi:MAG: peptidoglycan editing factor PgeF [Terriglobia bacterium]
MPRSQRAKPISLLTVARLNRYSWLRHGFTTRLPADLNLSYSAGQTPAQVEQNRRAVLRALKAPRQPGRWQLITLRQRHTDAIQVIIQEQGFPQRLGREPDGAVKLRGDALATNQPGLLLAVQVADCLPILLVEPARRVVAAVHAGWRGTARRIAEKTVGRLRQELSSDPRKLLAAIGPGIHRCCYEVGREVVDVFASQFPDWQEFVRRTEPSPSEVHWQQPLHSREVREPRPRPAVTAPAAETFHLDLVEANRRQLRAAGLRAANLWASPLCTACRTDLFFSHRAEHGRTGRMMGLVGLAPGKR